MVILAGDRYTHISQYKAGINLHPGTVPHLSLYPITIYYLRVRRYRVSLSAERRRICKGRDTKERV